jgi:SAM-dependent methyltransferase
MTVPSEFSFLRYLAAKKGVDDRALNRNVRETLTGYLLERRGTSPCRVLEVGCGIGAMLERLLDWGVFSEAAYRGIDINPEIIGAARLRLPRYAAARGADLTIEAGRFMFQKERQSVRVDFEAVDLFHFLAREPGRRWDLLLAHAFLDLVDLSATLPDLLALLDSRGLCYFTLNFDGATIFEPTLDPELDRQIERLYHRTMDDRRINGRLSGDSLTGRRLLGRLQAMGVQILAAGSSDWLVFAGDNGYAEDEAYFLHFIIHTVGQALQGHPEIDPARLEDWLHRRHGQIDRGELIYIAHQLDVLGQV